MSYDFEDTDVPVCPYCEETQVDAVDLVRFNGVVDQRIQCADCGKMFLLTYQEELTFFTRKQE